MKKWLLRVSAAACAAAGLAACAVGPDYRKPQASAVPERLPSAVASTAADQGLREGLPQALWWREFGDARLEALVQQAWQGNYDLRIALARVQAASEQANVARAARWPGANLEGAASHARLNAGESPDGVARIANPVQAALVFGWELDLFGRVRRGVEAAQASLEEREAWREDMRRLILAQVVDSYLELRGAQMLELCLQAQIDNERQTFGLVRERVAAGRAARAEQLRYEAQLSLLAARLPLYRAQTRAARNRLATLSGLSLDAAPLAALDQPQAWRLPDSLLLDAPAALLGRRPDVRAAERALAAATARVGVAQANRFPRISLAALLGGSGVAGEWLGGEASRWRAGGTLSWSLFDGGALAASQRAASADVSAAAAGFDKAVAIALEESDTAIANWTQLRQRARQLQGAQELSAESARLARIRYREGTESLLGVLEAERTALAAQEQLLSASRDLALATARSYVAVAGGFDQGH
ncbi:efflux transporter outer membrane subunit [Pseudoduganella violacea]|uniref:NodT family efflux transporter outer membrane factor (OMF) lipoprotein n=1 Tax=Pseudoduganella violacea TaxID=1715466 RepID=A0A7W5FS81_9BURK|nr:efflux transporter outer membrane subunit [Pseudoduganella violacea]MBB3117514.1 NodT family efflux transporter outer membrane factor (OMF) lipoprotein [Pseudoduganella violacea]